MPPDPPIRRPPPPFRRVAVAGVEHLNARATRVRLGGPELDGFHVDEPAASVRLLLPSPGSDELVMPTWNGNEFLLPDGSRPVIRTLTPLAGGTAVEIVRHGSGAASTWAGRAAPGTIAALSGPGRGYTVDPSAARYVLAGDETALPAITQLLEAMPPGIAVTVHVEIADPAGRRELDGDVHWHVRPAGERPGSTLFDAVRAERIDPADRVWAAGEAAAVQRIRRHLFDERGLPRSAASIRGYWKLHAAGS